MKYRQTPSMSFATVCTILFCSGTAFAEPNHSHDIELAQHLYSTGDTAGALILLTASLKSNPADATAHYLKANCFLKSGQLSDANYEYDLAERLQPKTKLAEYCRAAQARILSLRAKTKSTSFARVLSDDDEQNDDPVPSNTKSPPPTKNTSLPPGTLELIQKQAAFARKRAFDTGAAEAQNEIQKASMAAKTLQEKAERSAAHNRGGEPVALSLEELERIRSQAAANGSQLQELGKLKAAVKEQESQEKAEEISRQADNLQQQLLDERPSQNRLNPVGTNLYIRNYSKPPITPLAARAKSMMTDSQIKLGSKQTSAKLKSSQGAGKAFTQTKSTESDGNEVRSVKGEILK